MKVALLLMVLILGAGTIADAQNVRPCESGELKRLRTDYFKATKDYQASLEKLLPLYEKNLHGAEARLAQSKELFKQGLVSPRDLSASKRSVIEAQAKIDDVHKQMETTDQQIAEVKKESTAANLKRECKQAVVRNPGCRNWTLTAYRQELKHSVTVSFKLVCRR